MMVGIAVSQRISLTSTYFLYILFGNTPCFGTNTAASYRCRSVQSKRDGTRHIALLITLLCRLHVWSCQVTVFHLRRYLG